MILLILRGPKNRIFILTIVFLYTRIYQIIDESHINFIGLAFILIDCWEIYLLPWFWLLRGGKELWTTRFLLNLTFLLIIEARHGPPLFLFCLNLLLDQQIFKIRLVCRQVFGFTKIIFELLALVEYRTILPRYHRTKVSISNILTFLIHFFKMALFVHKFDLVFHFFFTRVWFL